MRDDKKNEAPALFPTLLTPLRNLSLASALCLAGATTGAAQDSAPSGAYLAGRASLFAGEYDRAVNYYMRALTQDPGNPSVMESLVLSQLAMGQVAQALPVAKAMVEDVDRRSQAAQMVIIANRIAQQDYDALLAQEDEKEGIGPLVDGLVRAWAQMGAGSVSKSLAQFDKVSNEKGLRGFALYHKALALAKVGDFEGAEAIFADPESGPALGARRGVMARAEILSQLERNEDAIAHIHEGFGHRLDPGLAEMVAALESGERLPFSHVTSITDGMAEVFYTVGAALSGEASDDYALIYARLASFLRPSHLDATLLSGQLLDDLGQYDLAVETYKAVPSDSVDRHAAELGRAGALRSAGKPDAAIEVLEQLTRDYPTLASAHSTLADMLREQDDFKGAIKAYDRALELTEDGAPAEWYIHYARGICHERVDKWEQAEADFRRALELRPDHPQVLNYLGYSLVEKQIKLDEALGMIERAVAARPDSGYIVDSLGWVLYRLDRYEEAVAHMERAVELMAVDPVVNDHLGDVYWAVGRYREAEFQWKRALSFIDPDDTDGEADPDRIRRKLEVGLDQVLSEEGAPPLKVANDN